jgi:hypothetical protein
MTGNTGLAGGHDKELAAGKRLGVALEHGGEVVELGGQGRSGDRKNRTPAWARPWWKTSSPESRSATTRICRSPRAMARTSSSARLCG